ncbi:MAG: PAS domain S-box protein [Sediminibacterium sp.]
MKNDNEIFSSRVLSSLSSHISVIDETGTIIAVNKAWNDFAKENGVTSLEVCSVGSNYFHVLLKAIATSDAIAQQAFDGMQAVFKKEKQIFELEYPCHSPNEQRWFILQVINLEGDESKVVASHLDITKRKNAEEASKASELKYRRLFESAKDGILILDAETGKITDVNPFLIDLLGYSYNEFLGKELWQIGLFSDVAASKEAFLELQKNKYIRYKNLPLKNKDGRIYNVEFVSNVYPVNDEKVIQCNIRDISDRILADTVIMESEARYKQIVENAHEGICIIDENNNNAFINQTLARMLGYEVEEMIGKSIFNSMAEEERISMAEHMAKRKSGISEQYEFKLRRKNGESVWTLIGTSPIIKDNVYKGSLAMVLDITERKNKDLELLKLTSRLQLATRAANIGIWDRDIASDKLIWDKGMYLIMGVEPDNFMPTLKTLDSIIHPEDRERRNEEIQMALHDKKVYNIEFRILWPDKSLRYIKANGIVEHDDVGNAVRMIGTNQDITHEKIAEIETLELLRQLQFKNKDLRQFAYIVSHNLRAPIAKIQGLAFLITHDPDSKEMIPQLLETIVNEVENLDTVVKDMNSILSVQDSGSKTMQFVLFAKKLKLIKEVLQNQIMESKAVITTDFHEVEGIITVKSYLYSILYNLVSNALKYRSPDRQLLIHLKTTCDKDVICLSVKDNGMGINLEKNGEKIFGLYKRFHGNKVQGRGIGLNLVKAQAESLGGGAEVKSTENVGSEFIIYLPFKKLFDENSQPCLSDR